MVEQFCDFLPLPDSAACIFKQAWRAATERK